MKAGVLVGLVAALSGCAGLKTRTIDRATLGLSTAALACDWLQTRGEAESGWPRWQEANAMLGHTPSVARVDAYFAGIELLNIGLWLALPRGWRSFVPLAAGAFETNLVVENAPMTGWCH